MNRWIVLPLCLLLGGLLVVFLLGLARVQLELDDIEEKLSR